jgi:hypothetical protein
MRMDTNVLPITGSVYVNNHPTNPAVTTVFSQNMKKHTNTKLGFKLRPPWRPTLSLAVQGHSEHHTDVCDVTPRSFVQANSSTLQTRKHVPLKRRYPSTRLQPELRTVPPARWGDRPTAYLYPLGKRDAFITLASRATFWNVFRKGAYKLNTQQSLDFRDYLRPIKLSRTSECDFNVKRRFGSTSYVLPATIKLSNLKKA